MMKKFNLLLALMLCGGLFFTSCSDDDDKNEDTPTVETGNVTVTENITTNTTWTKDNIYVLAGRIAVEAGATLTIEPGTIIKGREGQGASATALLVARGAKLMAEGTPALPIIFTSEGDQITPADIAAGNYASKTLPPTANGAWGGILIMGNARISASNEDKTGDVNEVQIEGIPTSDPNGLYGGNDDNDNSGVIKYISIRHGGTDIGSGNEINGLTLGGVGRGTTIENVEVIANKDDGIEFFGGSVNVKNALVWNSGDDAIDTDQSWSGTLDNFVVVTPVDDGNVFELDGPEGTMKAGHTIKNGSVIVGPSTGVLIDVDENSIVNLENIYITGIQSHFIDAEKDITKPIPVPETVTYKNVLLNVSDALSNYVPAGSEVPNGITTGTTPQADTSVFGWTWANEAGQLNF